MAMMMGSMHKMGHSIDAPSKNFMNPTTFNSVVKQGIRHRLGNMGSMRQNGNHAHMGNMGSMRHALRNSNHANMGSMRKNGNHARMGKMKGRGMIAEGVRRIGDCSGLQGHQLGRCRANVMGGCVGLRGNALKNCKAHRRRHVKNSLGGNWSLVKKNNGTCQCTQNPGNQIILGRYHSAKECENHRSHDC